MMASQHPFRLAHISDLHIGPLPPVTPRELLGKRLLGYLSWRSRKQRLHRTEVLAALRRDLRASAPDHVVITGDLVNLGLPAEFVQASAWLRDLGASRWISVVPGNHDVYDRTGHAGALAHWRDYMKSDVPPTAASIRCSGFPYLQRRGPLAIIGLSTAIATPPGFATGRLGKLQLDALDRLLADLAGEGCCRVVLLHHPPLAEACGWRKRLIDAAAFREIVARRGADLILHGHMHAPVSGAIEGREGTIAVFGEPSTSCLEARPERNARYRIHEIARGASGWTWCNHARGYDAASARFVPLAPASAPLPRVGKVARSC